MNDNPFKEMNDEEKKKYIDLYLSTFIDAVENLEKRNNYVDDSLYYTYMIYSELRKILKNAENAERKLKIYNETTDRILKARESNNLYKQLFDE